MNPKLKELLANLLLGFGCLALLQRQIFLGAGLIALSCTTRRGKEEK